MNPDSIVEIILEMANLKGFPRESPAHVALVRMVGQWGASESQVRGLVDAMLQLDEWPGPRTFRETFNRLYRPALGPPEHQPFDSHPHPSWFIEWSVGRKELPPGTPEVNTMKDLAEVRSMPMPPMRSNVHKMPVVKRGLLMWVRTEAEQAEFDRVAREVQRAMDERKKGA